MYSRESVAATSSAGRADQLLPLRDQREAADRAVADTAEAGRPRHHLGDVPVGVVVGEDGALGILGHAGGAQVAGRGEDRVVRVVRVLVAVAVRVDPVHRPGRGHELHPAHGAGGGGAEVLPEAALDLVDRGEDRGAGGAEVVGLGGRLVDRGKEGRDRDRAAGGRAAGVVGGGRRCRRSRRRPSRFPRGPASAGFGSLRAALRLRRLRLGCGFGLGSASGASLGRPRSTGSAGAGSAADPAAAWSWSAVAPSVVVCATAVWRGDRGAYDRRRDCGPDPSHQPRTWATRQLIVGPGQGEAQLADRAQPDERDAGGRPAACSAVPRTTLRTRALGTLPLAGRRGGSASGPWRAAWWRSRRRTTSVSLRAADLVGDECLGEVPGDLRGLLRRLGRGGGRAAAAWPGWNCGVTPWSTSASEAAALGRERGKGEAAPDDWPGLVGAHDRAGRPLRRSRAWRRRRRARRGLAPGAVGVGERPGEPGLDQPLQRLWRGRRGRARPGRRRIRATGRAPRGPRRLHEWTTRHGRPRHEDSSVISRLGTAAARY